MTERPRLAQLATEALAAERERSFAPPSAVDRARAIALIAGTIAGQARARRRRRWITGSCALVAAAACAAFAVGWSRGRPRSEPTAASVTASAHALVGSVAVIHDGRELSADSASSVVAGDRVVAAEGARAGVTLSTGTHLLVEGGSDLAVVEEDSTQIFALRAGAVQADVAKLHAGERFVVRTVDAEVEVRGTSFRLSLAAPDPSCGQGTLTRLHVAEGVVVVRARGVEQRVAAGESWPAGCAKDDGAATGAAAPPSVTGNGALAIAATDGPKDADAPLIAASTRPSTSSAKPVAGSDATAIATTAAGTSGKPSGSELQAQNDLFAQATEARKRGDAVAAIADYERYLARYPQSALAESATVERMRLLASLDRGRGGIAAKAYLAQYPGGFARAEAEELAARAP